MHRILNRRSTRVLFRVLLTACIVIVIAAGWRALRHAAAPVLPMVIVQLQVPHSGLLQIAEAQGFCAAEGLAVTVKTVLTGHDAIAQVLRGEADIGSSAETPVAKALAEGKQPKIIATIFSSRWSSGIVVRKDHGISKPADLKGKRIGYVFGTNTHYDLETFLALHNIALDSVTLVPGKPDALVAALLAGSIDGASIWMPFMTRMQQDLGQNAMTFFPVEGFAQTFNVVVRADYVARHRDAVDRLLRALHAAELFVQAHPDEAIKIIAAATGQKPDSFRGQGNPLNFEMTLKQPLLLSMENQVRWYFRRGWVAQRPFPDVLDAIETAPLRALKPNSVTIQK